jgi:hypothetical protein
LRKHKALVLLTSLALLLSATAGSASAAKPTNVGIKAVQAVQRLGTTRITGSAASAIAPSSLAGEVRPGPELAADAANPFIKNNTQASRVPSSHVPRPPVQNVVDATGTTHFAGVNHFVQRTAGTGAYANTQFSLEPPDQGLCVGNGFVVETVNTVIRVRSYAGGNLTVAMPLNDFFNLAPEIIRSGPTFGDFSSDPKCYYDAPTQRWFVSLLQLDVDPTSGNFSGRAHQLLAVSTSNDPTAAFNLFSFDVTDDGNNGTPSHSNCPCFGDQPLIGADANGFYVTTNEFPTFVPGFNGAMVYAMSKAALVSGSLGTVTSFFQPTLAEGQAYSLQPTTTPATVAFASGNGGTEYFLSALEFTGGLDNRIALWAMTNTSTLGSATPTVAMHVTVLDSEVYGAPAAMQQKSGSTPLRSLLKTSLASSVFGVKPASMPVSLIQSNDDRMNQAVYAGGQVWGAVNTRMKSPTGAIRTGIAWFDVTPAWDGSTLLGSVPAQGYVAVQNNDVVFPSVAANASGDVLVAFTLLGQDYYPSAGFAWLDPTNGTGDVQVVSWGAGPQDGFTGYITLDPIDHSISRWGDYSAATADESGNIWFATETINQSCSFSTFLGDTSCGSTRTILANWGTTIAEVGP